VDNQQPVMKYEIIYTEDYALIISDVEIKERDWYFDSTDKVALNPIYKRSQDLIEEYYGCKKIIAHRPLTDVPILEGVSLLPSFSCSQQDNVEKEAKDYADNSATCNYEEGINVGKYQGFIEGYKKAKETYKYTEEDMIKCVVAHAKYTDSLRNGRPNFSMWISSHQGKSFLQSLQQPKRPKSIVIETIGDTETINRCKNFNIEIGCVVSRCTCENLSIPKTTTNSQGQIELVGEYIYETNF